MDYDVSRFDKSFEEFFSLVDQLEVHLVNWIFVNELNYYIDMNMSKVHCLISILFLAYLNRVLKPKQSFRQIFTSTSNTK